MAPSIAELVEDCHTVATLPSVYQRVNEVLNDPFSSSGDVATVVSEDPGMTARVLRLVNSAFYNLPSRIESVTQAMSIMGAQQLHDLVLGTSVLTMFDDIPADLIDMEAFWKHSLATGVICRVLATERREANVERFFVAGLLHDIGRILMFMSHPAGIATSMEQAREEGRLVYIIERELMGYDHAQVGSALLNAWTLPESLQEPVEFHHDPASACRFGVEAAIVHIADVTAHALLLGRSGESFIPPMCEAAWHRLGRTHAVSPKVFDKVNIQYSAVVQAVLSEA